MTFLPDPPEPEADLRPTFRTSRVAFFLLALGIGLGTLTPLFQAIMYLTRSFAISRAMNSPYWDWGLIAPSRITLFLGSLLLLNRWRDRQWMYTSLFLFFVQGYMFGMWFSDHFRGLGPRAPDLFRLAEWIYVLSGSLILVGIQNMSRLAWDVCKRFESIESEPLYRGARGAATAGLSLWMLYLIRRINWQQPWPPQMFPFPDPETFFIQIAALIARTVAGFFIVILCAHACTACSRELARLEKQVRDDDPFPSHPGFL